MSQGSQFRLLAQRRFLPFFGAQALGAFNDNVYKNVLVIVATYQAASYTQLDPELLTNMAGGLFILPYVLFSGIAGQLADRFDKALVLKVVKAAEIVIMAIAALGFVAHSIEVLLGALFLMGVHSTFFAPAKYGMLPEVLQDTELVGGNALVEMGTFLAILLGTLAAGLLAAEGSIGAISAALIVVAVAGFATSMSIPSLRPAAPDLRSRLATVDVDVGQHPRRARIARRVPVDPRYLVVLVLRRAGARTAAAVREERARRQRADRDAAAGAVLRRHRHRLATLRAPLRSQSRDRPGAVRLDRPDRVRRRSVLRGAGCTAAARR